MSFMDFFKKSNEDEKVNSIINEIKQTEKELNGINKIIRVAFVFKGDNSFRPTTYLMVEDESVDLLENTDKLSHIKETIVRSSKEIDDEPVNSYTIVEIPFNLPHEILKLETYFALLNPQLELTPDQCNILPIGNIIRDEQIGSSLKFHALVLNYATKVFRMIDLTSDNKPHVDYEVYSNEMRITPKGCVEKYKVRLFDKYEMTFYVVNEKEQL